LLGFKTPHKANKATKARSSLESTISRTQTGRSLVGRDKEQCQCMKQAREGARSAPVTVNGRAKALVANESFND